jgi:hypothetical protein
MRADWLGTIARMICALAVAFLASPAHADLREFNAAISTGDFKTASRVAAQTWPQLDKAGPDIAVIAREFAWASMLAGEPTRAQSYTSFLIGRSSSLRPDDPSIPTWRVLDAWAAFAIRPTRDTRKTLADSLQMRAAIVGKDLISLRAAQALFRDQWDAGLWREAASVAESGAHIARDFGRSYADVVYQLEMGRLAASFVDRASVEAAQYLADLARQTFTEALATSDEAMKQRLLGVFFAADAWAEAANMRLAQQGKKAPVAEKISPASRARLTPTPGDPALPECQIARALTNKQLNFPANRRFEGWPGFATYRLRLAPGGGFSEIKLMGAAPHSDLADTVGKTLEQWRWQFASALQPPNCRLPVYYYLALQFEIPS